MSLIGLLWLYEGMPRVLLAALLTGFAVILLILRPGPGMLAPVALIGVARAVFHGAAEGRDTASDAHRTGLPHHLLLQPGMHPRFGPPPAMAVADTGSASLGATRGRWYGVDRLAAVLTRAYKFAPAAQVGLFSYTTVVFAGALGWIFWGEVPDPLSLAGAIPVCLAGIWTLNRANNRARHETSITDTGEPRL